MIRWWQLLYHYDRPHSTHTHTYVRLKNPLLPLLMLSSIISMMMRLLLDVSICFCPTPEPLLVVQSTSLLPYLLLRCPSISLVVFLGFFSHWYSSVMLLLAAVRFPFLTHAWTNLVSALLFCQPVSFLDIEYHAQSHFASYHVSLLSTIFLTMSFLLWGCHWVKDTLTHYHTQHDTVTHYRCAGMAFNIPIYSIPIPSRPIPNFLTHSHSLSPFSAHTNIFPSALFPFPPIPIPIHRAIQLYITTVHYCTGVTSSSIQYRNPDHLLSLY